MHSIVWCYLLCRSSLLTRISCGFWHLGFSWASLSFLGFSLRRRWCLKHRVLHQARPCRRLFWTSRKIMYAVCQFSLISWIVCLRTIRWSTVEHPIFPACTLVILTCFFSLSRWWLFRRLSLHCWPVWYLFCLSIFLFALSLCRVLWFHLLPRLGGCFQLCGYSQSWFWAVVSSLCLLRWRFRLGFYQDRGFCFFLVSLLRFPFLPLILFEVLSFILGGSFRAILTCLVIFFRPHFVFIFAFSGLMQVFKVVGYVFFCFCWIFDLFSFFSRFFADSGYWDCPGNEVPLSQSRPRPAPVAPFLKTL